MKNNDGHQEEGGRKRKVGDYFRCVSTQSDITRSLKDEGLIALYVEECKEPYHVQRTLLSRTSKWFEGALSKMTGDQKHEIRFADTSTETLELFLFWLLEGTVACIGEGNTEDTYKPELEELSAQVGLWIFADRHLIPHLQNAVMRRLDELSTDNLIYPSLPAIRYAYLHSTPNSCLRRFMIDQVSRGIYYGPTTSQKVSCPPTITRVF